jgi:tRNA pseudouridine55 synthase
MNPEALSGILVVDKPAGWTSHDVVGKVRALLGGIKVGHTGTLDPMATGVLVLLIGKATKEAGRFSHDSKRYSAEITFGTATDTYDATGTVIAQGDPGLVDMDLLRSGIESLMGESEQLPPLYSAVKVRGKRLYQYAREGKTVERQPRRIMISRIDASFERFPVVSLDIECSSGTYIRELANRLGEMCGCPAHLSALRRTAAGGFGIECASTIVELTKLAADGMLETRMLPVTRTETPL